MFRNLSSRHHVFLFGFFCYQTIIEVYLLYHFFAGTSVGCVLNTNQKYGK